MTKIGTALDVEPNGQEPSCHLRRLRQRQSRERKSLPNSSLTVTAQGMLILTYKHFIIFQIIEAPFTPTRLPICSKFNHGHLWLVGWPIYHPRLTTLM